MMKKYAAVMALTMLAAGQAQAALIADTGTPDGTGYALALDSTDWLAGQISISQNALINSVNSYLNDASGNGAGNYTVSLYSDNGNQVGDQLYTMDETYGGDGWNSASALNWSVSAGNYWVGIEVTDWSSNFVAPVGASSPLAHTAYNDGSTFRNNGYIVSNGLSFGMQVDATPVAAVPEPGEGLLLLSGLAMIGFIARRRTA